jgi:hypothetical protein
MLRKLALALVPLAVVLAACGGGGKNDKPSATSTPQATEASMTSEPTAQSTTLPTSPTPIVIATADFGGPGNGGSASASLFNAVNPLGLLGDIESGSASAQVNPQLSSTLLSAGDLPGGFTPFGDFGFNIPSEYGTLQMAANMFASGDPASSDMGTMVLSAVIVLPPQALDKLGTNGIAQLSNLSDADLEQMRQATEGLGFSFSDLHVLDGSGLGDGGAGMHMVMDFGGMMDAFGAPPGSNPFSGGLAMDMYMFLRGDHMYMTMVMWPASGASGVNSRGLAAALSSHSA